MCGRYTFVSPDELVAEFGWGELPFDLNPRYNVAPTQVMPVITMRDGAFEVIRASWGMPSLRVGGGLHINARAETAWEKPTFREAMRSRRCLVPADGFLEWNRAAARRQPHLIRLAGGRPFAMAGILGASNADGHPTFAILTTGPNELVEPLHDRMPVILPRGRRNRWMERDPRAVQGLLEPLAADTMESYPVSERVNSVSNDGPECLVPGPDQLSLF